jgi:hypothetical protein
MAQLLNGQEPDYDLQPFAPGRSFTASTAS